MKPQIATILSTGEYGQRDMTDEEIAELEEIQKNSKELEGNRIDE